MEANQGAEQVGVHPWERRAGESTRWYSRFTEYLKLGSSRSVLDAYNRGRGMARKGVRANAVPKSWQVAIGRFAWRERATAFDDFTRVERAREEVALRRQEQEQLLHTREEHRKQELELAHQLLEKADALLSLPVLKLQKEEVMEDGTVVQILVPNHNAFRVAAALVSEFSRVGRLALNLPSRHTQLSRPAKRVRLLVSATSEE